MKFTKPDRRCFTEFIGSFKGYRAGKVTLHEDQGMSNLELMNKSHFISLRLAHSAPETIIYEEVGIKHHALPHGIIDLLLYTEHLQFWHCTVL